jgi:aminopeptidase
MTRISAIGPFLLRCRDQQDLVDLVDLDELHLDALVAMGGEVLADVVGADRQLAVAAVGEDGELNAGGATVVEQRLDRSANRTARVEDVVDEDTGHPVERKIELRIADERLRVLRRFTTANVDVVSVEGDVELAERNLAAGEVGDPASEALGERDAARVDPHERDLVELGIPFDDLVRDPGERPLDGLSVEQDLLALRVRHAHARRRGRTRAGRVIHTPFRPHGTGLKGFVVERDLSGSAGRQPTTILRPVEQRTLERFADLAVNFSANVQPGQIVAIEAETGMEPIVRAVAERAYERGARFVDPTYFDPYVKRARLQYAAEDTLDFVPEWFGKRMLQLGEVHAARIIFVPRVSPGILNGVDPKRAGRDQLPDLQERLVIINKRLVNWTIMPFPTQPWADLVFPDLASEAALARLTEELMHVCRLDEDDPVAAWRERKETLHSVASRLTEQHFDAVRLEGPGTELIVGLMPTSLWEGGTTTTVDGVEHLPNLPTEEVYTTPDPTRADGVVRATKPLDVGGTIVNGLEVRFEGGHAVDIKADTGADVLRERAAHDEDASRLGELALVDREGRIGRLGTTFYNTLLDENAASHIALGNAYEITVGPEDRTKINKSAIHVDFMIGGDDVKVTGIARDGEEVPVLLGGTWQI